MRYALFYSMDNTNEVVKPFVLENVYKQDLCIRLKDNVKHNYREQSLSVQDDSNLSMLEYKRYMTNNFIQ